MYSEIKKLRKRGGKTIRRLSVIAVLLLIVFAGCVQTVTTYNIDDYKTVPKVVYTAHLYTSGIGERLRAVFLKSPETGVEIVPYSRQITTAKVTFSDALTFMEKVGDFKNISIQGVKYKDKTIGYLLTFAMPIFSEGIYRG
ncbi:MAG: hypothetical protein QMD07_05215 [Thermodesulfovibrionales bacterium]|nr:hypothetical protein [Thermodesulfovibrionales bacterium]